MEERGRCFSVDDPRRNDDCYRDPDLQHVLVVQIPKDQIYRVPPPENALIVERHQNPVETRRKLPPCCCCCRTACGIGLTIFAFIVIMLLLLMGLFPGVPSLFLLPKDPNFSIDSFSTKNLPQSGSHQSKRHIEFDIRVKAENRNPVIGVSYQDGSASLSTNQNEIDTTEFPRLDLGLKDEQEIKLAFQASTARLSQEINKSMESTKQKVPVSFGLSMNVNSRMKIGLSKSRIIKFTISCDFTVDKLATKGQARVLSQQCESKRKIL